MVSGLSRNERREVINSLVGDFRNTIQIYRGTIKKNTKFDNASVKIIKKLIDKIDNNKITTDEIRKSIYKLAETSNLRYSNIGAAQKIINVFLKYYCIIAKKPKRILKQLDCPIDSTVINYHKLKNTTLKNMTKKYYITAQDILEEKYKKNRGFRLKAEFKAYDAKKSAESG